MIIIQSILYFFVITIELSTCSGIDRGCVVCTQWSTIDPSFKWTWNYAICLQFYCTKRRTSLLLILWKIMNVGTFLTHQFIMRHFVNYHHPTYYTILTIIIDVTECYVWRKGQGDWMKNSSHFILLFVIWLLLNLVSAHRMRKPLVALGPVIRTQRGYQVLSSIKEWNGATFNITSCAIKFDDTFERGHEFPKEIVFLLFEFLGENKLKFS